MKSSSRRAEVAVTVAKDARAFAIDAAARYEALVREVEATPAAARGGGGGGGGGDDAAVSEKRRRLTLASHETDAEVSGSERKWESLREKAIQSVRALETELRALG